MSQRSVAEIPDGISFQLLKINANITSTLRPPAWDNLTRYQLFADMTQNTVQCWDNTGGLNLRTLQKEKGYYENVIGVTMFNEGERELLSTLRGIWRNVHTASRNNSSFGNCLVVILVDGYSELHKKTALVSTLEEKYKLYSKSVVDSYIYQYVDAKKRYTDQYKENLKALKEEYSKEVDKQKIYNTTPWYYDLAFAFESRLAMGAMDLHVVDEEMTDEPAMDVLFVVKAENKQKLHSHLWLFYGFCMLFEPKYVYLIDVGTEPMKRSLLALHDHLRDNSTTGGCCGEIIVKDASWYNSLLGAQWFEYKLGHITSKSFESVMGFIPVLPGAFSAYRWQTLIDDDYRVLKSYFKPFRKPDKLNWTLTNIYYLAEDRIMSEKIMKVNHCYSLRFIKEAKAYTEGANSLHTFMKQRRRWINGAWFAMIKIITNLQFLKHVCDQSKRGFLSKVMLSFQHLYMLPVIAMTWVSPGTYFIGYYLVVKLALCSDPSNLDTDSLNTTLCSTLITAYMILMCVTVFVALATPPESIKLFWLALCWLFSATGAIIVGGSAYLIYQAELSISDWMTYHSFAIIFVIALAILCYWENFFTIMLFSVYYIALTPTYINILTVFAMCRTDDVSWGTRGKESEGKSLQDDFSYKKMVCLVIFLTSNVVLGGIGT